MKCPYCKSKNTKTADSRFCAKFGGSRRRRRDCDKCFKRFTTYEVLDSVILTTHTHEKSIREQQFLAREYLEKLQRILNEDGDAGDDPAPVANSHWGYL